MDITKQLADALVAGRMDAEAHHGLPVDDFELTLQLDVFARWVPGYPGNREEPPEPAGYEIQKVMCRGMDITNLLSDDDLERLKSELVD